jgi:hypothetical protein
MEHKRIGILFLVGLLLASVLGSCIDPYPFDPPLPEADLVVDGYITDQEGAVEVRLSTAAAYGNIIDTNNYNKPVTDAIVRLHDDAGGTTIFNAVAMQPGLYRTIPMVGEVGKSYELEISWNGKTFLSRPERMPPPVPVDTVYAELVTDYVVNALGVEAERCRYEIRVNVSDPAAVPNQYYWKYRFIYELKTAENLITGVPCFVRAKGDGQFGLTNDAFVDGNQILDFPIGSIPYHFWHPKFLIDVDQHSLTPEAYAYWAQIKQQIANVGSIFDPPPSSLRGNIYCKEDTNILAYGYFRASSVTTNYTFFSRPVNGCWRDDPTEARCRTIPNASSDYPPDPRWR